MKEGKQLSNYLKIKGISVKQAAKILGKKDRQSVYSYFKSERFRPDLERELLTKLGFDANANIDETDNQVKETSVETEYLPIIPTAADYLAKKLIEEESKKKTLREITLAKLAVLEEQLQKRTDKAHAAYLMSLIKDIKEFYN